ncbi:hypothetical protein [Rugamonas sp.]|uniref:arsenate reductase/protein-tyrosine-phosphatase family protein n=1 Tax=Rugamonas sp. TaxID=1926287 RepID=UPI0025E915ED|nr:hypothetical protein [Rugamonas sp.]
MKAAIDRRFGTWRGLARLALAYAELLSGRLLRFRLRHPERVRRVVFVCLGNICRSAYAEQAAHAVGLNVVSVGLSTTTGAASPVSATAAAARRGAHMTAHRACDWSDYEVRSGDLLLVMEIRQAHAVRRRLGPRDDVQVGLLGMWCAPPLPHLHDPFELSDGYFDSCFARVQQAVGRLALALPNARLARLRGEGG